MQVKFPIILVTMQVNFPLLVILFIIYYYNYLVTMQVKFPILVILFIIYYIIIWSPCKSNSLLIFILFINYYIVSWSPCKSNSSLLFTYSNQKCKVDYLINISFTYLINFLSFLIKTYTAALIFLIYLSISIISKSLSNFSNPL